MSTCRDVMTPDPVCCYPADTVERAAKLMKSEDVGSIPVVENPYSKKLVGIVTDRDLALEVVADGGHGQSTSVESVMSRALVTCHEDDDVDKAIKAMSKYQVRRIPVVNGRDEIVGIIAQADIATRVEQPEKTAEVVEEISRPEGRGI